MRSNKSIRIRKHNKENKDLVKFHVFLKIDKIGTKNYLIKKRFLGKCFLLNVPSNIDLILCVCVCMFVVPRSLPHSIFVYIPRVLFVQLPPFREGFSMVPYNIFCLFVCLFECLCCMSRGCWGIFYKID